MSKIVETIHHGGYRNTRTLHIHPVNVADIAAWLDECPYSISRAEAVAGQICSIAAGHSTARPGSIDRGWINWEVS